ncbi:MAG: 6-pyruvoyl-tetrahydropterin synthase-related protein, partial [Acidimicrobiales bacterium]
MRSRLRRPSAAGLVTFGVVAAAAVFIFVQLQPSLIFRDTTPAGGDMGAHVWGPAFMRDHLLPHGRLTGWAPDWYAGFAFPSFYFPLPTLLIVIGDILVPYNVAFKVVSVLGMVSLPVAAWAFGRLAGLKAPGPACLAVAAVPFLFERSFTIYGGNIPSTLAGEFAFSISLSMALVFLGVVARGLDAGRHKALAAGLLALTLLCHVIPTFFAIVGAVVITLLRPDRRRLIHTVTVGVVSGLLVAFWALPFALNLPYTNDMGYEKITLYTKNLFPRDLRWLLFLAGAGAASSILRRSRFGTF